MIRWLLTFGVIVGLAAPAAIAEGYLRLFPPRRLVELVGDAATSADIYKPDAVLGADYRSYDDLRASNADDFNALGALDLPRPTWAFFGNSFVQMQGMLGDTAQARVPNYRIFVLRRYVPIELRIAQLRLLLEHGLRPERIFFVFMTVDMTPDTAWPLALAFIDVTKGGAILHGWRKPPSPLDMVVVASRLALMTWLHTGLELPDPTFDIGEVANQVAPITRDDLRRMIGVLGELLRGYHVPITLVLIPDGAQVRGDAGFAFQDVVAEIGRSQGLDVFDARELFIHRTDQTSLFIPDGHFSPFGNDILFDGLIEHLRAIGAPIPPEANRTP